MVGCDDATTKLHNGNETTVLCAEKAEGRIYTGTLPFSTTSS